MGQAYEQWTKGKKKPVQNPREPYHLVSLNLRKKLIMMVCEQDVTIYKACKTLKINYSTGKSIIKNYKRKEIVTSKKSEHSEAERPQISQEELYLNSLKRRNSLISCSLSPTRIKANSTLLELHDIYSHLFELGMAFEQFDDGQLLAANNFRVSEISPLLNGNK